MTESRPMHRRHFLLAAAAVTGSAALTACSGSDQTGSAGSTGAGGKADAAGANDQQGQGTGASGGASGKGSSKTPLPKPSSFQESPRLTKQVDAGTLPPVQQRLPDEPYVIPHSWVKAGNYGGKLKMNVTDTDASNIAELFYGYSPLRFLNDGSTVGPGIVTKWKSNPDASEWEFTLRKGLKWSDGKPVTTKDVLFWWQDMATYDAYTAETVPDECKSGKGTICKLTAKDDLTWQMSFDAPAPLTADRLATWVNGYKGNGPTWIVPRHFVKQFHPRYNKKVPKNWASVGGLWETHASFRRNPKCPTLAGFQLTRYREGRSLTWQRNPYYYAVTATGDQIPYIDGISMTQVKNAQVSHLKIGQGNVDFCVGPFNSVSLADVSTLKRGAKQAGITVLLWDSGSGTGSMFFANRDYYQKKYRDLFREPKFLQALSLGFDRKKARTAIYFNTGFITTGTMSPKAIEFHVNETGKKVFTDWRDAYVRYDPDKANSMLDALGLERDRKHGYRTFPDGSKLELRIDRPADASDEHVRKDNQLVRDWKKIGIHTRSHPVPPNGFADIWAHGKYMCHSDWEVGDGPNCLVYPQWLLPMETSRWAPLQGAMYQAIGTPAYHKERDVNPWKRHPPRIMPTKDGPDAKLWKLYDSTKVEPDAMKRHQTVWQMMKIHISDGPFFQGTDANTPQPIIIKNGLQNVPRKSDLYLGGFVNPWTVPTPAVYDIETFFWDKPNAHGI